MDMNFISLHIHELRSQCRFVEASVDILNQSLEKEGASGVFYALQNILTGTNQISRLLWSPRKKGKERAASLRKILDLPEKHPLNNENILMLSENSDEANDAWISQSKGEYILYDFIGDIANSQHKEVLPKNIFRAFDAPSKIYSFRGIGYNMEATLRALADVSQRVNQVHARMFPEQWTEVDDEGKPVAENKEPAAEAKAAPKKAAPKKTAAKKPAAKKTTTKKAAPKKAAAKKPAAKKTAAKKTS